LGAEQAGTEGHGCGDVVRKFLAGRLHEARSKRFRRQGEARDFIKSGQLRLDGALPTNTNGGLLGEGYIHGFNNMTEAVRQMRRTAANQVRNAETAFVSSGRSAFILGRG
jgi:acetyl-CoA acetyltransferase